MLIALLVMVIGSGAPGQSAGAGERIAVLVSAQEPPFEEGLEGLQGYLERQGVKADYDIYRLAGDASRAEQAVLKIRQSAPRVIVTLGSLGTDSVLKRITDIPVVAGLILRPDNLRGAPNATGVALEFPLEAQFTWLQVILPEAKTIGVVYNPEENGNRIEAARRIARSRGLRLVAQEVHTPQDVPASLNTISRSADVLWGLTDSLALSPQIAKHLLLFSFRNNIPFIGPSRAWVKAGALYSLDWDYRDLGGQCGEMVVQVLSGERPGNIPPAAPRKVLYSLNRKTAQQMKVPIPDQVIEEARFIE